MGVVSGPLIPIRYSPNVSTVSCGSQSPVALNAFSPASTSFHAIFLPDFPAAASSTSCAAGQMSTPVPSPSMKGMMGSSGTLSWPSVSVIFSGIGAPTYSGRSLRRRLPAARALAPPPLTRPHARLMDGGDDDECDEVDHEDGARPDPDGPAGERSRSVADARERHAARFAAFGCGCDGVPAERAHRVDVRRTGCRFGAHACLLSVLRSAASTALRNSIAIVVGPTPPTRGVIAPATSSQRSSTSGSSLRPSYRTPPPT